MVEIFRTAPIIHLTVRVFCQLLLVRSRPSFGSQIQAVCIKRNCEIFHSFCYRFTTDSNKRLLICLLKPLKFYPLSCTFGFSFLFAVACIIIISTVQLDRGTTAEDKECVLSLFWNSWNVSGANNAHLHNSPFMFFYLHIRWAQNHHDSISMWIVPVWSLWIWRDVNQDHLLFCKPVYVKTYV